VDALFARDEDRLVPGELTRGPWRPDAQHGGPPAALLGWGAEQVVGDRGRIARVGVELIRPVPLVPLEVRSRLERVSRRVTHAEVELAAADTVVARARALVLHVESVDPVADAAEPDLPGPEAEVTAPSWASGDDITTYHRHAIEHRFVAGSFTQTGPAVDWVRLRVPLVAGEETSGLCRVLAAADFGSGISAVFDHDSPIGLINADLTVGLHRHPEGEWVRLDARSRLGPQGVGLCTTALADTRGPVGTATQSLMSLILAGDR
jgi:hypothetical protein